MSALAELASNAMDAPKATTGSGKTKTKRTAGSAGNPAKPPAAPQRAHHASTDTNTAPTLVGVSGGAAGGFADPGGHEPETIAALFAELQALAPFKRKGWSDEAKDSARVVRAFQTLAGKDADPEHELVQIMRGVHPTAGEQGGSGADLYVCCEAIRRGARTLDDVAEVWAETPAWRDEKAGKREDYIRRTVAGAVRAVLGEAREITGGGGGAALRTKVREVVQAAAAQGIALNTTAKGSRLPATFANVTTVLRNDPDYAGCLRYNEMLSQAERAKSWRMFDAHACDAPGPITDDDLSRLRVGVEHRYGMAIKKDMADEAADMVARDSPYHPVKDRLIELEAAWDGKPRLADWLVTHARAVSEWNGKDLRKYLQAVGPMMMVSAVARTFSPGCKVDSQITLIGEGGAGKSELWRTLAECLGDGLFTDDVPDMDGDPVKLHEATAGKLIVEIAEGAAIRNADLQKTKASLTRRSGKNRVAFARRAEERPRRFVLVSTANDLEFLPNGDAALRRRFWPVLVNASERDRLDLKALEAEAPQLWGEAMALWREMTHDGAHQAPLFINPDTMKEAYAGWSTLLEEVSDERGAYADLIQELNRRWHGVGAGAVGGAWPEEGCTSREIAVLIGYDKALDKGGGKIVTGWCRASGLFGRKRNDGMRWWRSTKAPASE